MNCGWSTIQDDLVGEASRGIVGVGGEGKCDGGRCTSRCCGNIHVIDGLIVRLSIEWCQRCKCYGLDAENDRDAQCQKDEYFHI